MKLLLSSLFSGLLFGLGLALSGMTNPANVLNFLNIAGNWDPTLLFVLGGAVGVTVLSFSLILKRKTPLLDGRFYLPTRQTIDRPLVIGAVLFGLGWGISGYCPGPAIASLAHPNSETWIFLPAMLTGIFLHRLYLHFQTRAISAKLSGQKTAQKPEQNPEQIPA